MFLVKINKKPLFFIIIVFLLGSIAFNIYNYIRTMELLKKYESLACSSFQLNQASLVGFLVSADMHVQEDEKVEIFDVKKGEIIKRVELSNDIQREAEKFLKGITGMYAKVKAFPEDGYIVKIPLNPSVIVKSQWLNNIVDKVFVIFPKEEAPYLLVLDEKERPLFYNFEGSTDMLLENLSFQPEN
ncbi:MAG TPA: hypothetical protein GXX14_05490 [Clostridiaceae bacterium]|nr:hypothetical protein [Clostridiaceae bacterium]